MINSWHSWHMSEQILGIYNKYRKKKDISLHFLSMRKTFGNKKQQINSKNNKLCILFTSLLILSYNKYLYVKVKNVIFDICLIEAGVPQGSVLYIIYSQYLYLPNHANANKRYRNNICIYIYIHSRILKLLKTTYKNIIINFL